MTDLAHQLVGDRYELRSQVGEGGYGAVYRGVDRQNQQAVAIKVLSHGAARDPDQIERMVREQQAMVALAGTGVVGVLDLCELPTGQLCLVMEWLDGEDFEHHLAALEQNGQFITLPRLLEIVSSVANTLDRAHQMGIVHRDIKPANIFLTSYSGTTRILDFGLSRMKWSKTLTQAGTVMGSPSYIAPETWRGQSKLVGHQADLYALGVIVFRALTGQLPFGDNSLVDQMKLVTTAERPSVRHWRPQLPRAIDGWARKALAIDPKSRFKNGQALSNALAEALDQTRTAGSRLLPLPATLDELQGAVVSAFGAAASLLKRFAGGVANEPVADAPTMLQPAPRPAEAPSPAVTPAAVVEDESVEDRKSNVGDWLSGARIDRSKALKTGLDMLRWLKGAPTISLEPAIASKAHKPAAASSKEKKSAGPSKRKGSRKRKDAARTKKKKRASRS
ncbi:MAG TPA: protein kinase [Polyangiaceae bacterium]|nr:protein kinase [Polyangiaceae bacterium]